MSWLPKIRLTFSPGIYEVGGSVTVVTLHEGAYFVIVSLLGLRLHVEGGPGADYFA